MRCRICGEADIGITHACVTGESIKVRPVPTFDTPAVREEGEYRAGQAFSELVALADKLRRRALEGNADPTELVLQIPRCILFGMPLEFADVDRPQVVERPKL